MTRPRGLDAWRYLLAALVAGLASLGSRPAVAIVERGPGESPIVAFVQAVTDKTSKDYVAPADASRCSTTTARCGAEQPLYFQFVSCSTSQGGGAEASGVEGRPGRSRRCGQDHEGARGDGHEADAASSSRVANTGMTAAAVRADDP